MLISQERIGDIQARKECLELMAYCLKNGYVDFAKEFGEISKRYAVKIKGDYSIRDKKWAPIYKALALTKKSCQKNSPTS